ncbi:MAG: 3-deoxy-D-manno-octulosonate 8-phosphate phosphatase (KDO 8-P phosphatase) [Candidatus Kentron sp. G]|nr:MAG: 3-deoxy-D-manno-octulosonate 8-phosphate phosphatase (KDO 8-P phosphatase) [Candidatus Kentron sp. G]VFM98710.1 MAG: 3-deoxy-D-manno-octulosonate 8-phosphate phosphatase (KDO 8-P phosphatase) [Candidatus Kentron sp. G]VFN01747.1 MAG: 3-deoxy-D-manno-octulosonate 8-phosphate phosphatase (KDO 8-P phosphatase) [Candidatus Kentron sp. G]
MHRKDRVSNAFSIEAEPRSQVWPPDRELVERAANIKIVLFDVDGVLTDGRLYFDGEGNEYKAFHVRDGHGLKSLMQSGVEVGIISGRNSPAVARRMAELGITHVYQGCSDKCSVFDTLLERLTLRATETAYVGDDIPDLPVMRRANLAIAVADAHPLVTRHAHWRTPSAGGRGAARDVCELVMSAQGTIAHQLEMFSG